MKFEVWRLGPADGANGEDYHIGNYDDYDVAEGDIQNRVSGMANATRDEYEIRPVSETPDSKASVVAEFITRGSDVPLRYTVGMFVVFGVVLYSLYVIVSMVFSPFTAVVALLLFVGLLLAGSGIEKMEGEE